jgi:arginase family enzyme
LINILNFDSVYENQPFLRSKEAQWIDLQSIPNTNLFCEKPTLQQIASAIEPHLHHKINLIGSGNYHYVTYLFLSKIKNPFTLILFDHHTDTLKSPSVDLISCGSWVLEALNRLPNLKRVLIVGVSSDGEHHVPASVEGSVSLYTKHSLRLNFNGALKRILKDIPTEEVYLSIDKDVLDTREAMTAWDHGSMQIRQVLHMIKVIIQSNYIHGIDICGEYPITPSNAFEKETKQANRKNSDANQFLLYYLTKWLKATQPASDTYYA